MRSCRPCMLLLLLPLLLLSLTVARVAALWHQEANEIPTYEVKRGLMMCRRTAVCGLVQANAWGVNAESFCACPGREPCPLLWDPEDGRSVTHGSNQYKYCRQAPQLSECTPGQLAMTDALISHKDESMSMAHNEYIHCRCPAGHQLKQTNSQWKETADSDIIFTTKTCTKMPQCEADQHCKLVTQSASTSLVQVNCACAPHQMCPTLAERQVETQPFGRGTLRSIFCR